MTDIEGNVYNTVVIGNQTWMKENLKTTKLNNGTSISNVANSNDWINLTTTGYCWYNNDVSNRAIYGAMYNWNAVNSGKLCPAGWHVPSDNEWKQMEVTLGMSQAEADDVGFRGTIEGGMLKEIGTAHWTSPNAGATNSSKFTALPGGYLNKSGAFVSLGQESYWWTSTPKSDTQGWDRGLTYTVSTIDRYGSNKIDGFYIRCIKD